jgi:hypothetical protein
MTRKPGFAPSVGRKAPASSLRTDLDDLSSVVTHSELDLHIVRLLALHPALKVRFRNHDLASLDAATKQMLLEDMNEVLGVRPLKKRSK